MRTADHKPAVRYAHGASWMSGANVEAIIGNDTASEVSEQFASPRSPRVGALTQDEANAEAANGWTPIHQHRRPDLLAATTALATVISPILHVLNGEVILGALHIPHLGARIGRRVVVQKEGHEQPIRTFTISRASHAGIHPADLPTTSFGNLRQEVHPDLRHRGLPIIQTLKKIATPITDAMQFVKAKGADLTYHIPRDAEKFVQNHGGDRTFKIRKAPLRSGRHELTANQASAHVAPYTPGPDGITF